MRTTGEGGGAAQRAQAEAIVRAGDCRSPSCCRRGWAPVHLLWWGPAVQGPTVNLLADVSIPSRPRWCRGCCRKSASRRRPVLARRRHPSVRAVCGTPDTGTAAVVRRVAGRASAPPRRLRRRDPGRWRPVRHRQRDAAGQGDESTIAFQAAGIGVMFLLFSAPGPAGRCSRSRSPARWAGSSDRAPGLRCARRQVGLPRARRHPAARA